MLNHRAASVLPLCGDSARKRFSNSLITLHSSATERSDCSFLCEDSNNIRNGAEKSHKPPSSICISCSQRRHFHLPLSFPVVQTQSHRAAGPQRKTGLSSRQWSFHTGLSCYIECSLACCPVLFPFLNK